MIKMPKLKAENMYKGSLNGPNGCHCLAAWCGKATETAKEYGFLYRNLLEECVRQKLPQLTHPNLPSSKKLCAYNDYPSTPLDMLATVWNNVKRKVD